MWYRANAYEAVIGQEAKMRWNAKLQRDGDAEGVY